MRPHEVLDYQADFHERIKNHLFRNEIGSLIVRQAATRGAKIDGALFDLITNHSRIAYSYHVAENMTDYAMRRAEMMDDRRPLADAVPPTEIGFLVLEKPIRHTELRGEEQLTHMIMWSPITTNHGPSWIITMWNDVVREPDEVYLRGEREARERNDLVTHDKVRRIIGRWDVTTVHIVPRMRDSSVIGPMILEPDQKQIDDTASQGVVANAGPNTMRIVVAIWDLMSESVQSHAEIPRAWRRRAEKAKIPPRVTVVALRRTDHAETEGESHIEWQHRWHVRGHKRKIRDRATGEVKYIVDVRPHVKGPADKPIVTTRKVYDLRR